MLTGVLLSGFFFAHKVGSILYVRSLVDDDGTTLISQRARAELQRLGPPTLSPDGQRAAFKATRYDDENDEGEAALWMASTGELEANVTRATPTAAMTKESFFFIFVVFMPHLKT